MKFLLLVLLVVMSMKTAQGCSKGELNSLKCVFTFDKAHSGCNEWSSGRTAPVNWDTAFEDMAQSGDRAIPELGLPIDGQIPGFMPSRERTIDQLEPGL